jgi:hypothetical protein
MTKVLGLDETQYTPDEIKSSIRSVFLTEAFRRFNLPMPFDEIADKGKGGGIASLVHQVVHQRTNVGEFLTTFLTEVTKADMSLVKKNKDRLKGLIDKLNEASGTGDDTEGLDGGEGGEGLDDTGEAGADDLTGSDDNLDDTGSTDDTPPADDTGSTEEESETEEEPETTEDEPTPDADTDTPPASGGKPKPGDPDYDPFA